jgi:hypothetical protein
MRSVKGKGSRGKPKKSLRKKLKWQGLGSYYGGVVDIFKAVKLADGSTEIYYYDVSSAYVASMAKEPS